MSLINHTHGVAILAIFSILIGGTLSACDSETETTDPTCFDGDQNGAEDGVDCGGICAACVPAGTCTDGIQNSGELGIDCGGPCDACVSSCEDGLQGVDEEAVDCGGPCAPCATCSDGIQNADEEGTDCGGSCAPCSSCSDGIRNGSEEGIDCGGTCTACPTCVDGVRNGSEQGIDCGGNCSPCPSCNDGIQNGAEQGVDCGGSCASCQSPPPSGWTCAAWRFDSGVCDCGCGTFDSEDCQNSNADACEKSHCGDDEVVRPGNNALCDPIPPTTIENPSFEMTPTSSQNVPGWTEVGYQASASATVVGPAQTDVPAGSRALKLTSTTTGDPDFGFSTSGYIEIASSEFLPPEGNCELTFSHGDSYEQANVGGSFGTVAIVGRDLPSPLGLLALVEISNASGTDYVSPPEQGYSTVVLPFYSDGLTVMRVQVLAATTYETRTFHLLRRSG